MGWIASVFNLTAALLGLLTGLMADHAGRRHVLKFGLAVLGMGALLGAVSQRVEFLFLSRVVEGLGFVSVVVAAPALVREVAGSANGRLALGLWSSYTSLGMTLMLLASPAVLQASGWRGSWSLGAIGAVLLLLAVRRAFPGRGRSDTAPPSVASIVAGLADARAAWLLAACFAFYTLQWVGMMIWLPTFLLEELDFGIGASSAFVAAIVLVNAPGNWAAGWLLQRGWAPRTLILGPAIVMGVTGWANYTLALDPGVRFALCMVFSLIGGILPAAVYGCVPALAARHENFGSLNGLVVQASNMGSLLGPPLAAVLVSAGSDWRALGPAYLATSAVSALAAILATRSVELRLRRKEA